MSCQIVAIVTSMSLWPGRPGASASSIRPRSRARRALRSILPLGVRGRASSSTNAVGTMWSGNDERTVGAQLGASVLPPAGRLVRGRAHHGIDASTAGAGIRARAVLRPQQDVEAVGGGGRPNALATPAADRRRDRRASRRAATAGERGAHVGDGAGRVALAPSSLHQLGLPDEAVVAQAGDP